MNNAPMLTGQNWQKNHCIKYFYKINLMHQKFPRLRMNSQPTSMSAVQSPQVKSMQLYFYTCSCILFSSCTCMVSSQLKVYRHRHEQNYSSVHFSLVITVHQLMFILRKKLITFQLWHLLYTSFGSLCSGVHALYRLKYLET